jgi:SAM-dependent methyltransferase
MPPLADALIPDSVRYAVRRRRHRGEQRYCPVCDSQLSSFRSAGEPPRADAECPVCDAMERHRMIALLLNELSAQRDGRKWRQVLHVAPHLELGRFVARRSERYVAGSLAPRRRESRIDVTALPFADGSFDLIVCSHVLEHVPDDDAALGELHRVLAADGQLLLLVPIVGESTFEDPTVVSEAERLRVFGQADHVRVCGDDYHERIERAGFRVRRMDAVEIFTAARMKSHGGLGSDCLFFCRRMR